MQSRPLTVVGLVVTPDSAGAGAAMTFEGYQALNPSATQNIAFVDFRPGAPDRTKAELAEANFSPPDALVVPTSVRALGRVTAAPFLLAAVLALLLVVGCAYLLATSVRSRRRDLAILRALGSNSRQLRTAVHWQATLVAAAIVVVGLPLGVVVGRRVVSLLTTALGIVPGARAAGRPPAPRRRRGAVLIANGLALLPARRAAPGRHRPALTRPLRAGSGRRDPERDAGAAEVGVADHDVAAVGLGHRRGDRQPEAGTAGVDPAGLVEPAEPAQDELPLGGGNARPVVVDVDPDPVARWRRPRPAPSRPRAGRRC